VPPAIENARADSSAPGRGRLRLAASGSPKAAALEWIPRPVRDPVYRLVARWRYRIWGRLESCPMPAAVERRRFV